MSGSGLGYNILTDASAAFAAHTIRAAKSDGGTAVTEAGCATYPGSIWADEVDDQLILLSEATQGDSQVDAWDVAGALNVDGTGTIDGAATLGSTLGVTGAVSLSDVLKFLGSSYGNWEFETVELQTTDANTTQLWSKTLADPSSCTVFAFVRWIRSDGDSAHVGQSLRVGGAYRDGGAAVANGDTEVHASGGGATVDIDEDGNDIEIEVKWDAVETVHWSALILHNYQAI
jgi:hypothetical protein